MIGRLKRISYQTPLHLIQHIRFYHSQCLSGHLDRYVSGLAAEEILSACDETIVSSGDRMTNPAIHFFRGLRHRNLAAIRHATQRGLNQLHHPQAHAQAAADGGEMQRARAQPLVIQGLRTNPKDQDSHVLFFDIEALVGEHFYSFLK